MDAVLIAHCGQENKQSSGERRLCHLWLPGNWRGEAILMDYSQVSETLIDELHYRNADCAHRPPKPMSCFSLVTLLTALNAPLGLLKPHIAKSATHYSGESGESRHQGK